MLIPTALLMMFTLLCRPRTLHRLKRRTQPLRKPAAAQPTIRRIKPNIEMLINSHCKQQLTKNVNNGAEHNNTHNGNDEHGDRSTPGSNLLQREHLRPQQVVQHNIFMQHIDTKHRRRHGVDSDNAPMTPNSQRYKAKRHQQHRKLAFPGQKQMIYVRIAAVTCIPECKNARSDMDNKDYTPCCNHQPSRGRCYLTQIPAIIRQQDI